MDPNEFEKIIQQVPAQQRRLLDQMVKARLVAWFAFDEKAKRWAIRYTPAGFAFLRTFLAVTDTEPDKRIAMFIALDQVAEVGPGSIIS